MYIMLLTLCDDKVIWRKLKQQRELPHDASSLQMCWAVNTVQDVQYFRLRLQRGSQHHSFSLPFCSDFLCRSFCHLSFQFFPPMDLEVLKAKSVKKKKGSTLQRVFKVCRKDKRNDDLFISFVHLSSSSS